MRKSYILKHGHRADYRTLHDRKSIKTSFDPQLTDIGQSHAFNVGERLYKELKEKRIFVTSSPYKRCLQTV